MNAPAPSKAPSKTPGKAYLNFSRTTARALSVGALGSLSLWFALKFLLTEEPGPQQAGLQLAVGVLALAGMVASVLLFLSTYSFRANAPDAQIDEREVVERNRAYFRAYQTLVFVLLLAYIVAEVLEKALGWVPTRGVIANFLTLLIFAALTLPAAILAWWDAGDEG